jgi:hypothetical protein
MKRFRQDFAAELMLIAATTGKEADIERVIAQMERALRHDNWLWRCPTVLTLSVKMVRLVCDKCGGRGQYRIGRSFEQYGPDIAMPDLRHELAQCPHRRDMTISVRS